MTTNTSLRNSIISILFLIPFIPLIVATNLYFPFITGKAFVFRILVEVALILYVLLVIRDRSFLPKKSPLLWSMVGFVVILALATIFSKNPMKSFWSNYERMEGYVTILHLFAYFIMLSGVYSRKVWFWFTHTSLILSIVVGLTALADKVDRVAGTLGNSSYLGVYALLHVFLAGYFLVQVIKKKWSSTDKQFIPWVIGYSILVIFNAYILYRSGTRGAFLGLLVGGFITLLLLAIFERRNKIIRYTAGGIIALGVIAIVVLGLSRDSAFVQQTPLLSRFTALFTLNIKSVFQNEGYARTVIWSMAANGFKERPVIGWGQDNFSYVFAKYYDPRMYNQEQWFDRSHNVFFDWLIAGGALGLISYLSLFAAMLYLIWKKNTNDLAEPWEFTEKAVFTGLIIAYFIHNLFVFDNLVSYLLCFALFAYVHQRSTISATHIGHTHPQHHAFAIVKDKNYQIGVGVVTFLVIGYVMYASVISPYTEATYLIKALQAHAGSVNASGAKVAGDEAATLNYFQQAFSQHTFGDTETMERLSEVAPEVLTAQGTDKNVGIGFAELMKQQYGIQIQKNPDDPRLYIFYGLYLGKIGQIQDSLLYLNKALALSPNKQTFLYQAAIAEFQNKNPARAVELMKKAYDLNQNNLEALSLYMTLLVYNKQAPLAEQEFTAAKERGLAVTLDQRILQAYIDTKQYVPLENLLLKQIVTDPKNVQLHVSLAALYLKDKKPALAIKEIQTGMALEPQFVKEGEYLISEIKAGRDPSQPTTPTQ